MYSDQLLCAARRIHVVYSNQLLGAARHIHLYLLTIKCVYTNFPQAGFKLGSFGQQVGVLPSESALLDPPLKFHNLCAPPGKIYMPLFLMPI